MIHFYLLADNCESDNKDSFISCVDSHTPPENCLRLWLIKQDADKTLEKLTDPEEKNALAEKYNAYREQYKAMCKDAPDALTIEEGQKEAAPEEEDVANEAEAGSEEGGEEEQQLSDESEGASDEGDTASDEGATEEEGATDEEATEEETTSEDEELPPEEEQE